MDSSKELKIYGEPETWSKHKIVCLHVLADQSDLLRKLDMKPEDCGLCDVYWDFNGQLFFISFFDSTVPGVNLQLKSDLEHPFSFVIKTSNTPITKGTVEKGVDFLMEWIKANDLDAYIERDTPYCILNSDLFI